MSGVRNRLGAKICGLTREADARAAREAGARFLGFVFAESPRQVGVESAPWIARLSASAMPGPPDERRECETVGVFADATAAEMAELVRACRLDYVQLHGDETPEAVPELARALAPARLIRAVMIESPGDLQAVDRWAMVPELTLLIVEAGTTLRAGGWSWAELASLAKPLKQFGMPWLIAGGLTAATVAAALLASGASGADVASGVESSPGTKDPEAVRLFIAAVDDGLGLELPPRASGENHG